MIKSEAEAKKLKLAGEAISSGATILFWVLIVLSLVFSFALGMLMEAFETLQIINALPLM